MTYSAIARWLHWSIAILILGVLSAGFFMTGMAFSPVKLQIYGVHKSIGLLVLVLAVLRLVWRFLVPPPAALETHKLWEKGLAKIIHVLLYGVMFVMPLSGWIMSSAGDFPVHFFGLFEVPDLTAKDESLFKTARQAHGTIAFILLVCVGLHVAGAFKHHFIDRDETLARMTWPGLGLTGGGLLAIGAVFLIGLAGILGGRSVIGKSTAVAPEAKQAPEMPDTMASHHGNEWIIDGNTSRIEFEVLQYGQPFKGSFENFDGSIVFDPDDLENSHADIEINVASIKTGSDDRDTQARSADWFDVSSFPQARFVTTSFEREDANHFVAHGTLTIRDVSLPVSLPFNLEIMEPGDGTRLARIQGSLDLDRLDFGVGQGQWSDGEAIGKTVKIWVQVMATQPLHSK